ncbi:MULTISPECIES: hypothetical protein [Haloarcula]|uniref:hypothetical protein n=1 Tax=Haloarcula TaxID=2237 RepID=UPI0023EC0BE2|nr:hypothetical protein [Halomicroarcula sp. XH51]
MSENSPTVGDDGPAVGAHLRAAGDDGPAAPLAAGVYRVVGTTETTVTLIEVGDGDGERVHTGRVVTVDRDGLSALETVSNPDDDRSLRARFDGGIEGLRLSAGQFWRSLAARPLPSAAAFALFATGEVGSRVLTGYDVVFGVLILVGGLSLVYLGSLGMD